MILRGKVTPEAGDRRQKFTLRLTPVVPIASISSYKQAFRIANDSRYGLSAMGQAVDRIAATSLLPAMRVDTAMVDEALRRGRRIGVLATLHTTMMPTVELVRQRSNGDPDVRIEAHVCERAFAALKAGDIARHDELVKAGLRRIEPLADVVIPAQASMARVLAGPQATSRVPILLSLRLAIQALA